MIVWSKKSEILTRSSFLSQISHFCQQNQFDIIRHRETKGIHMDPLAEMGIAIWYPYGSYSENG